MAIEVRCLTSKCRREAIGASWNVARRPGRRSKSTERWFHSVASVEPDRLLDRRAVPDVTQP
ncbi:hypothetical protein [Sorangium sp. So ce426]|uniref:hypothetical protein n=1 Tax=Sorangium sp. So ce426 TaxID=3133312 RepID=UPI003F5B4E1A